MNHTLFTLLLPHTQAIRVVNPKDQDQIPVKDQHIVHPNPGDHLLIIQKNQPAQQEPGDHPYQAGQPTKVLTIRDQTEHR